ncbi:MAG TPA: nitric oxide reductase activation protein [Chromatiaceae bacterium]|nr:nitric oxide reductase activation protein [Chromatiaceae bacterium]
MAVAGDFAGIQSLLDTWLETEFTFRDTDALTHQLLALSPRDRQFVLTWTQRVASTNLELAYQFARLSDKTLASMEPEVIEAWIQHAMDQYDRTGLAAAMKVVNEVDGFIRQSHERASGSLLEDRAGVLAAFVRGLSGRELCIEEGEDAWTDSETLYLPGIVARLSERQDNFLLHKAMATHLWAQTRFGTFRVDLGGELERFPDPSAALRLFHALEALRLDHCVARELPGLAREMARLREALDEEADYARLRDRAGRLARADAHAGDTLALVGRLWDTLEPPPPRWCYQGKLDIEAVRACSARRVEREKAILRVKLAELADELKERGKIPEDAPAEFDLKRKETDDAATEPFEFELSIDEEALNVPEFMRNVMTSIILDFGEIPEEYLVAAGPGEYDLSIFDADKLDPEDVWSGAYHEEGAFLHPEWDFARQCYRKNWCVLRELEVKPRYDDFYARTMRKHARLIKSLHRTFEALRGEDRLLKKQPHGDDVDIDALVEAWADLHSGHEMSDRLFTRMHKEERNIAVMFMVDMSGSTRGWINDAERESLILLSESLEILGDRYAIYGFSGTTRKRCELYRVKAFDDPYDEDTQARISAIEAQDYTRMGVAIRHLSGLLNQVDARIKLLVTLSDGKPEDYDGYYRGEYGIEDTRQALFEARRDGIHPFCITIDEKAREYLPHLYGAANYVVIKDVDKLPLKVSDIYRKLTS